MEASKDTGGYTYHFVDQLPELYICIICHHPSRDPYMTGECCQGQTICKSCLDQAMLVSNGCPCCRSEEKFCTYPNWRFKREINNLLIYCTNEDKGCEWKGEVSRINIHLESSSGCEFEEVNCSNECGKIMQRQYLTSHVETECPRRKVNCQYCHDTGEHQFIEGQHKEECPSLPLPCPNNCEVGSVPREDMEKHRSHCRLEVINCLNNCGNWFERWRLTDHIETECPCRKVNCMYCHDIGECHFIKGQHKEECPKLPLPCPNNCEVVTVPREDIEEHRKECPLEIIQCHYHSVGCETRMARKDQEKHESDQVKEHLKKTTNVLTNILHKLDVTTQELTSTKLDLSNAKSELTTTNLYLANAQLELANAGFKLADMSNQLANTVQHSRTMEALIYITTNGPITWPTDSAAVMNSPAIWPNKLAAMAVISKSGDQECPVVLKINGVNKMKKDNTTCYSDSFYTHHKGFKMCLYVNVAGQGEGKDTHLSCFLYLMEGPYDDKLTWPLRGKIQIKLLNQFSDSKHYPITLVYDDSTPDNCANRVRAFGWGKPRFISHEDLSRTAPWHQYLKDDCLFFKVTKL